MKIISVILLITTFQFEVFSKDLDLSIAGNTILNRINQHIEQDIDSADLINNKAAFCNSDEEQFLNIESQTISPLKTFLKSSHHANLDQLISPRFRSEQFPPQRGNINKSFEAENMTEYNFSTSNIDMGYSEFYKNLVAFKKSIKGMDFVSFDTIQIYANKKMRTKDLKTIFKAELLVRFDLRYQKKNQERVNDRGILKLSVAKDKQNWKIEKIEIQSGTTLVSKENSETFKNVATELNTTIPSSLRREAIRRGGYATALGDYSNDGVTDLLVATSKEVKLFKGLGDGQFKEFVDSGLENHTLVKSAAFVDLFNTGLQDLILVRFSPENQGKPELKDSDIIVYKNLGEKFKRVDKSIFFKNRHYYAMPLALGDFNKDGLLDLFVGFPGFKDFTFLKDRKPMTDKQMLSHGFFINEGKGNYEFYEKNIEDLWRPEEFKSNTKSSMQMFLNPELYYPHSAVGVDYNLDGNMDVVVIDDRTKLSPVYKGLPKGGFVKSNDSINFGVKDYGMGVAFGDLFGNQKMDFVMSSVNFASNERMYNSCLLNWDTEYGAAGRTGLRIYKSEGEGYSEVAAPHGLDFAGYGLSGVEMIDYNNDGNLDLFVSNGLWSGDGDDLELDLSSRIARASNMTLFENDLLEDGELIARIQNKPGNVKISNSQDDYNWLFSALPSQSAVMNMLVYGKTKASKKYSYAGYQKKRVFRNNGGGNFTEVGYGLGLDSIADGYMVGAADFNKDGRMDIVFRNSDPAVSVTQFPPLEIFMNQIDKKNNSLVLKLVGAKNSNLDSIGAIVKAEVGNKTLLRQLTAMNGTIQSEKVIHFGLGKEESANNVEITWPNGQVQKIVNLKKGYHQIVQSSNLAKHFDSEPAQNKSQ